jgi:ABC-type multidrug transport system fused ATPase/permease subunit
LLIFNIIILKIQKKNTVYFSAGIFNIINTYPYIHFKRFTDGELIRNITTESKNIERMSNHIFSLIVNILYVLGLVFIIFLLNSKNEVLIIILIFFGFLYIFTKLCKKYITKLGVEVSVLSAKISENIIQNYHLFLENYFYKKKENDAQIFLNLINNLQKKKFYTKLIDTLPKNLYEIVFVGIFIIIIISNYYGSTNIALNFEKLFVIIAIALRLLPYFFIIQTDINGIFNSNRSLTNVHDELELLKKRKLNQTTILTNLEELELKNISFQYNNKKVLNNFSFKFVKGDFVGFFGKSGAGKSTISLILSGIIFPMKGSIYLNKIKLNKKNKIYEMVGKIGYVSQNVFMKNDSVKNNIILGDRNFDKEKYYKSLKISGVEKILKHRKTPDKLIIKNNGSNLSVGQRQRIAIARAFYHAEQIIILDEATSNLDVKAENEILKNLKKIHKQYLIIMISHKVRNKKIFTKSVNI